ncbi:MAG TPA: sigma-54 dependent transcriptional regulator [Acidobacteriaceae bacterium]|nr:sigma-54 dependent transcriptional regulator [Acidobacteriaceae bacterium]
MGYGLGSSATKATMRTVVLASADAGFRARLRQQLTAMRWSVREAGGGAEAMAQLEVESAEAMVVDSQLPDLEVGEFANEMRSRHPVMDLVRVDIGAEESDGRSPRRNELLHALRQAQKDTYGSERPAWSTAPVAPPQSSALDRLAPGGDRAVAAREVAQMLRSRGPIPSAKKRIEEDTQTNLALNEPPASSYSATAQPEESILSSDESPIPTRPRVNPLPEMVGDSPGMVELARMIRLVAPRSTTVLIHGATGTGKELVAKAVHRLSARASKPYLVLNCAAIPEALLEAELFGHTRGAFTGAVQSRTGRIEAANGGTLFLDEIGEMPLALQAKMLRFLESGELQRVGDNETLRVDVRVVAASHQPLLQRSAEGAFRLDLYHRLAVFPVSVPALRDRMEDVLLLADHILGKLGEDMPVKRLSSAAAMRLMEHDWPGNVRELAHVLERGVILAEDRREIGREEIRF